MHNNFGNMWIGLALQQFFNYQLVNVVVRKSVETCCMLGPQTLVDSCLPQAEVLLNPLEFHGKRPRVWPPRRHVEKRLD